MVVLGVGFGIRGENGQIVIAWQAKSVQMNNYFATGARRPFGGSARSPAECAFFCDFMGISALVA
jgi:hypothetical protein